MYIYIKYNSLASQSSWRRNRVGIAGSSKAAVNSLLLKVSWGAKMRRNQVRRKYLWLKMDGLLGHHVICSP